MRYGCPWRDLPEVFGRWNTIYKRFNAWSAAGKLTAIFTPWWKSLMSNGSSSMVLTPRRISTGADSEDAEVIGKSRAGNTSKTHLAVDAYGLPIAFRVTGGEVHESKEAPALITELPSGEALVADKGYDSDTICKQINAKKMLSVIPRKRNSIKGNASLDRELYR